MTIRRMASWAAIACLVGLFAVALAFRVVRLDNLPGVNGDEAWYGVQAMHCLTGRSVSLRTPTGLPLNPFFSGLIALELLFVRPSIAVLRAPAALCGILTVALTYVLGARITDRTTALIASILLATSPVAIGYSRFGWDPCQTPLVGVVALYFAFRGNTPGVLLAFLAGMVIHLTNVFLLPILLLPYAARKLRSLDGDPAGRRRFLVAAGAATGAAVLAVLAYYLTCVRVDTRGLRVGLPDLFRLETLAEFLTHYGRLISGVTIYEYIVGPVAPGTARLYDWVTWAALVVALEFGTRRLVRDRQWEKLAMIAGLGAALAALYVIGGPHVLRPHFERYGLFLLVPSAFGLAIALRALVPGRIDGWHSAAGRLLLGCILIAGVGSLIGFQRHYFDVLRATGGESHVCFRTNHVEPKRRLVSRIARDLAGAPGVRRRVIAEDWWLYSPLEFLALSRAPIDVVNYLPIPSQLPAGPIDLCAELRRGSYVVAYIGGPVEAAILKAFAPGQLRRWDESDYGGRKFLALFRLNATARRSRD